MSKDATWHSNVALYLYIGILNGDGEAIEDVDIGLDYGDGPFAARWDWIKKVSNSTKMVDTPFDVF